MVTSSECSKVALKNNNRTSAAAYLRSKKLNEAILKQRYITLSRIEEVYNKIADAVDQVALVQIMKDSTVVLRGLHAQAGGADKVEDVVERLKKEMSRVDEVSIALEAGTNESSAIDEDAVDEELAELEKQAKAKEDMRRAREVERKLASLDEVEVPEEGGKALQSTSDEFKTTPIDDSIKALKRLSMDKQIA